MEGLMATVSALFVGSIALVFGGAVSLALSGGLGPCGSELTIGETLACMIAAIVISLIGFVTVPSMRALSASLFSLPMGFAILFLAIDHEWMRCLSVLVCIVAAGITVVLAAKGQSHKKINSP
jgi:hypothetical protein